MRLLVARLALATALTACQSSPQSSRCPPDGAIGALHGSAFFFQNGPTEAGRLRLREAIALIDGGAFEPTTRHLVDQLAALDALPADAGDERARGAEEVRVILSEWRCLSEALHERLHRGLPPIPGQGPARLPPVP
jgi:hypothetical protein